MLTDDSTTAMEMEATAAIHTAPTQAMTRRPHTVCSWRPGRRKVNKALTPEAGAQNDVEMQPLNDSSNPFADPYGAPPAHQDPNAILNDCREVSRAIDDVESRLQDLQRLHRQFVSGTNATNKEIDAMGSEIMTAYRALSERVKRIKSRPGE